MTDYAEIRAAIGETYPDTFYDYERRMWEPGGFQRDLAGDASANGRPRPARPISSRRAAWTRTWTCPTTGHDVLRLMTLRSNDQFNTTVYGYDDRFRGITDTRMVVLMNRDDIDRLGLEGRAGRDAARRSPMTASAASCPGLLVPRLQHPARLHRRLLPGVQRPAADLALRRGQQDPSG